MRDFNQIRMKYRLKRLARLKSASSISDTIRELVREYGMSPQTINNGYCLDFAIDVVNRSGKGRVNRSYRGHDFVVYGGRYYDAEHPEGVSDVGELNYFRRNPHELRKK